MPAPPDGSPATRVAGAPDAVTHRPALERASRFPHHRAAPRGSTTGRGSDNRRAPFFAKPENPLSGPSVVRFSALLTHTAVAGFTRFRRAPGSPVLALRAPARGRDGLTGCARRTAGNAGSAGLAASPVSCALLLNRAAGRPDDQVERPGKRGDSVRKRMERAAEQAHRLARQPTRGFAPHREIRRAEHLFRPPGKHARKHRTISTASARKRISRNGVTHFGDRGGAIRPETRDGPGIRRARLIGYSGRAVTS
jgi:hypothetical protein